MIKSPQFNDNIPHYMIDWQWKNFVQLTVPELYQILVLRSEVFVLEQTCIYLDPDGLDPAAWHLTGRTASAVADGATPAPLLAYLRVFAPGVKCAEASLGRVLTHPDARGSGLGQDLLARALMQIAAQFGNPPIRISAQLYLQRFYEGFGFVALGTPYDEDGIAHIDMLRQPT
jgi:ElaA protein